jgi:hypothetical protein
MFHVYYQYVSTNQQAILLVFMCSVIMLYSQHISIGYGQSSVLVFKGEIMLYSQLFQSVMDKTNLRFRRGNDVVESTTLHI